MSDKMCKNFHAIFHTEKIFWNWWKMSPTGKTASLSTIFKNRLSTLSIHTVRPQTAEMSVNNSKNMQQLSINISHRNDFLKWTKNARQLWSPTGKTASLSTVSSNRLLTLLIYWLLQSIMQITKYMSKRKANISDVLTWLV